MKTQQTNISEVRLVYRTKVKASERLQVKCSKDDFSDIYSDTDSGLELLSRAIMNW
jgi:hypothetical protein